MQRLTHSLTFKSSTPVSLTLSLSLSLSLSLTKLSLTLTCSMHWFTRSTLSLVR